MGAALFILLGAMVFRRRKHSLVLFLYGLLVVVRALHVSASLFSEERRNQTSNCFSSRSVTPIIGPRAFYHCDCRVIYFSASGRRAKPDAVPLILAVDAM
jgi:hypothetical protein